MVDLPNQEKKIIETITHLVGNKIAYVTLNKTADAMIRFLKQRHIDTSDMVFLDVARSLFKQTKAGKNIEYCITFLSFLNRTSHHD